LAAAHWIGKALFIHLCAPSWQALPRPRPGRRKNFVPTFF